MPASPRRWAGIRPVRVATSSLQNDLDHRMAGQRAVQLVELLAAGRGDRDRDAEVVAALAVPQFDGGGVERRIELPGNRGDGVNEAVDLRAHDLDRKGRRILDQRW